jgi:hypothetical protein
VLMLFIDPGSPSADDRYVLPRDLDRGRSGPPPPVSQSAPYSRIRPHSPSPVQRPANDARPPLKPQREEYPPPSCAPGPGPAMSEYYPRGGRPGGDYLLSGRLSPSPSGPPPLSAGSSFDDRSAGLPPRTGSSAVAGGGEREYL